MRIFQMCEGGGGAVRWDGGISHDDGWGNPPPILFLFLTKRERAVDGPREKIA